MSTRLSRTFGSMFTRLSRTFRLMIEDRTTLMYFSFLVSVFVLGIIGPLIAPYEPNTYIYTAQGELLRSAPPSIEHPLGTTAHGQDVLSRLLYGTRPTVITGLLGGSIIVTIGMTVGIVSGYVGGTVDEILMRITDMVYGVPLIPFALVLVALFGIGFFSSIVVIGVILWRSSARVIRSQVLQIKERPYILAAKTTGASTWGIIRRHILPNVATMAVLFFALGIGYAILLQAGLAFLGVSNPAVPTWGNEVRNAYNAGAMGNAPWWGLPPGILISLTVLSTFMFGRGYESVVEGETSSEEVVQ